MDQFGSVLSVDPNLLFLARDSPLWTATTAPDSPAHDDDTPLLPLRYAIRLDGGEHSRVKSARFTRASLGLHSGLPGSWGMLRSRNWWSAAHDVVEARDVWQHRRACAQRPRQVLLEHPKFCWSVRRLCVER